MGFRSRPLVLASAPTRKFIYLGIQRAGKLKRTKAVRVTLMALLFFLVLLVSDSEYSNFTGA
jgi:hypothetical protein